MAVNLAQIRDLLLPGVLDPIANLQVIGVANETGAEGRLGSGGGVGLFAA